MSKIKQYRGKLLLKELEKRLFDLNCSLRDFEVVLSLPMGITDKWKSEEIAFTPEDTALMKIIIAFPWILEVAGAQFEPSKSKRIMMHEAVEAIFSEEKKQ